MKNSIGKLLSGYAGIMLVFSFVGVADATTAYYHPTPYPKYRFNGSAMPQNIEIVHLWDGWIDNYYYGLLMQKDVTLQFGGWGDIYRTYLRFDTAGLPSNPSQAVLWMVAYPSGSAATADVWFQKVT